MPTFPKSVAVLESAIATAMSTAHFGERLEQLDLLRLSIMSTEPTRMKTVPTPLATVKGSPKRRNESTTESTMLQRTTAT